MSSQLGHSSLVGRLAMPAQAVDEVPRRSLVVRNSPSAPEQLSEDPEPRMCSGCLQRVEGDAIGPV